MKKSEFLESKLGQLLSILLPEEIKNLTKWVHSPFAHSNKKVTQLYDFVIKYYPSFESSKLTRQKLYAKLHPGKPFSDGTIRNLLSELHELILDFIAHQQLKKNRGLKQKMLVNEWLERGQLERFGKGLEVATKAIEQKETKSNQDYLDLYNYYYQWYHHPDNQVRLDKGAGLLQKMSDNILLAFASAYAPIVNEKQERAKVLEAENYDIASDIRLLTLLQKQVNLASLDAYLKVIQPPKTLTKEYFIRLKEELLSALPTLTPNDGKILYYTVLNIFIRKMTTQYVSYSNIFELYRLGIDRNLAFNQGKLSKAFFINLISAANTVNQHEYALQFIHTNLKFIPKKEQEDLRRWGEAFIFFYSKRLEEAEAILSDQSYEFKDEVVLYKSKLLRLMVRFELFELDTSLFEYFEHYSLALEQYFRRKQFFNQTYTDDTILAIQFTKNLAYSILAKNDTRFTKLAKKYFDNQPHTIKTWLAPKFKSILEKGASKKHPL